MTMIGEGKALPEHIGPFLMLLRFKEETPEEIVSFFKAAQASITQLDDATPNRFRLTMLSRQVTSIILVCIGCP